MILHKMEHCKLIYNYEDLFTFTMTQFHAWGNGNSNSKDYKF